VEDVADRNDGEEHEAERERHHRPQTLKRSRLGMLQLSAYRSGGMNRREEDVGLDVQPRHARHEAKDGAGGDEQERQGNRDEAREHADQCDRPAAGRA
jgi:hypothetical protein